MADVEDPQINLDHHMAQNLQNQLFLEGRIQMRYKQLRWTSAFLILKSILSCFVVLVCFFYQLISQYAKILDLLLLLLIIAFGVTNICGLLLNLRRKIPSFQRFRANPDQYERVPCSTKTIRLSSLILSLSVIALSLSMIIVEQ